LSKEWLLFLIVNFADELDFIAVDMRLAAQRRWNPKSLPVMRPKLEPIFLIAQP
jgi:hypothetical protein